MMKDCSILGRFKAAINDSRGILGRWDFPKGFLGMHES